MANKSERVTLGSVTVEIRMLPGEEAALAGLRVAALFGVAGLTMIEEVFAAKGGAGLTTAAVRGALEGLVLTIQRARPEEVKWLFGELSKEMRLVQGELVSTQPLAFNAVFANEPNRVWFYYELLVRAVGVNYADFFTSAVPWLNSLQKRLEERDQKSSSPNSSTEL